MKKTFLISVMLSLLLGCGPSGTNVAISQTPTPTPCPEYQKIMVYPPQIHDYVMDMISGASTYVYVATYVFSYEPAIDALIDAHDRGVKVEVVMSSRISKKDRPLYKKLVDAGIPVKLLGGPSLFHEKYVIADGQVLLTSSNISARGLKYNYEFAYLTDDPEVVANVKRHFADLVSGDFSLTYPKTTK